MTAGARASCAVGLFCKRFACAAGVTALLSTALPAAATVPFGADDQARQARNAITELDIARAHEILDGTDLSDPEIAIERALLAIYEGDCDTAAELLARPDLAATDEGAEFGDIARGCARGMAAVIAVHDEAHGVIVRLQDDDDRALVPLLADVAAKAREMLSKELGVLLPIPMRIDLVRDQFTLAALTGLPERAARTTGTVAVAKWGRVIMISPRATGHGYPWLDTLAHELTHLALSRGTRDKAPLWLQEGVAKRQETRWREAEPFDDVPPADRVAASGIARGLGLPLDKLGPSIAMLPSAEQAAVVFAQVSSFVRYWAREAGEEALPQLVIRLKDSSAPNDFARIIGEVSTADFATWDKRWRDYLKTLPKDLPADLVPGADVPHIREIAKRVRLGELLEGRGHHRAAAIQRSRAQSLLPFDASLRCALAESLLAVGETANAGFLVDSEQDIHGKHGRWWSLHGLLHPDAAHPDRPFRFGLALDPLNPPVACQEKLAPELPSDPLFRAICEAARRIPR